MNNQYGHLTGDQILIKVADILKSHVMSSGFIGRRGGEEFILVAPGKSSDTIANQAETIRKAIENTSFPQAGSVTASFGVSQWGAGDNLDTLVRNADSALYSAKASGRNQVAQFSSSPLKDVKQEVYRSLYGKK